MRHAGATSCQWDFPGEASQEAGNKTTQRRVCVRVQLRQEKLKEKINANRDSPFNCRPDDLFWCWQAPLRPQPVTKKESENPKSLEKSHLACRW